MGGRKIPFQLIMTVQKQCAIVSIKKNTAFLLISCQTGPLLPCFGRCGPLRRQNATQAGSTGRGTLAGAPGEGVMELAGCLESWTPFSVPHPMMD